jgi:hypothetical protein
LIIGVGGSIPPRLPLWNNNKPLIYKAFSQIGITIFSRLKYLE